MDKYRIDSHKLLYHVDRLGDWLRGATIYPIYMEVSPSGGCNHRCVFCGLDFMGYQARFLNWDLFRPRLAELARLGLRSMMHGGEGEPLLHRHFAEMVEHGSACGLDQAITTNGVLLKPGLAERLLPHCQWIKISINAGRAETYARVHRTRPADFDAVLDNARRAAEIRRRAGFACTLGMQMVLLDENRDEAALLAALARQAGMDYFVVKPYSQHPQSRTETYKHTQYSDDLRLADTLGELEGPDFQIVFRARSMQKWDAAEHPYRRCLALPFWSYVDAGGGVWACSAYLGDDRFYYGNLQHSTFQEIWEGPRRQQHLEWVRGELDTCQCRVNCRMDEINRYLWDLKHPPAHVNFI
ncbi:MAG: radical SAM protein [Thermoguttaceae bacterium]|jgi:MoaA/NifB/PqqE/SkfB family radical SAM enzyme